MLQVICPVAPRQSGLSLRSSWADLTTAHVVSGCSWSSASNSIRFILSLSGSQGNICASESALWKGQISFSRLSYDRRSSWNLESGPTDAGLLPDPPGKWEIGAHHRDVNSQEMSHILEEDGPGHEVQGASSVLQRCNTCHKGEDPGQGF